MRGELWANVWGEDQLFVINPDTGHVRAYVDLKPLLTPEERRTLSSEHCLNGIAYDADADELYVTGKCWPKLFRLKVPTGCEEEGR